MLASLLLVASLVLAGPATGVAASTGAGVVPVGSSAIVDDVSESRVDSSTRHRTSRRVTSRRVTSRRMSRLMLRRRAIDRSADRTGRRGVPDERLLLRPWRRVPPSWRGPPVLRV